MKKKSLFVNLATGLKIKFASLLKNPYRKLNLNWIKIKYYKHLPTGKLRKHKFFGKNIYFYSPTEFLHAIHEIFIEEVYKQELPPKPFIIDCGANIGLSVLYLKHSFSDASIIAFEPDDKNFELLEKNISSFGLEDVLLKKEAVWIENREISFSNDASMSSKISEQSEDSFHKVKAKRLKDCIEKNVHFLKMDIEGAEFKVLCDIEDKLHMIDNMFIEYHGSYEQHAELSKIFSILSKNNFHYYIKEATGVYKHPLLRQKNKDMQYDVQLNIFCSRN